MLVLVPSLNAAPPAPAASVELAQIFAPANSAAASSLTDDWAKAMPSDLFLLEATLPTCTASAPPPAPAVAAEPYASRARTGLPSRKA
jgi:hypothetical protein